MPALEKLADQEQPEVARAVRRASNRLLGHLPLAQRKRVLAQCEHIDLPFGKIIVQAGDTLEHVYFPEGCMISQIAPLEGMAIEVSLVGDEGMFGINAALGVEESPVRGLVQGAGPALRMGVDEFRTEIAANPALRSLMGRYSYVLIKQITQTAACTRFHVIEQRLARWLLTSSDRAHSPNFQVTQAFLATMLGVRRVSVTTAAAGLSARGLIRYSRGNVAILDARGLERASCGCFRADLEVHRRILGDGPAEGPAD
jgi:CRP-like cAMP-binding protein